MAECLRNYQKPALTPLNKPGLVDTWQAINTQSLAYAHKLKDNLPRCHLDIYGAYNYVLLARFDLPVEVELNLVHPITQEVSSLWGYSAGKEKGGYFRVDTYSGYEFVGFKDSVIRRLSNGAVVVIYGT